MKELKVSGYERVLEFESGFIAIHSTERGPALGGLRIYPYRSREEALEDALRLAKTMTNKAAAADLPLGGGKAVLIADPKHKGPLLQPFAAVVEQLGGQYICAEDVGSTVEDMAIIHRTTKYVVGLPNLSGDPARFTAWGIYCGMRAVAEKLWGTPSLKGKRIAIQGVGSVGSRLARLLFWRGADLLLSDIDQQRLLELAQRYEAEILSPEGFFEAECDILSPCAMGAVLNESTIPKLRCRAIAGSANNQLATAEDEERLQERKILYAPDYVINAGGLINAAMELTRYSAKRARDQVACIEGRLRQLLECGLA